MLNITKNTSFFFAFILLAVFFSSISYAATDTTQPRQLKVYGDWGVYVYEENGHKVCFMAAAPYKSEGKYTKRGEIFTFITNWTEDGTKNVFNVLTGYNYKTGSMVHVSIDGKKYLLPTTKGEMAWSDNSSTDNALANAIQKGSKMLIKGTSQRGTLTTDSYSLKGSGNAYKAMNKACT